MHAKNHRKLINPFMISIHPLSLRSTIVLCPDAFVMKPLYLHDLCEYPEPAPYVYHFQQ